MADLLKVSSTVVETGVTSSLVIPKAVSTAPAFLMARLSCHKGHTVHTAVHAAGLSKLKYGAILNQFAANLGSCN